MFSSGMLMRPVYDEAEAEVRWCEAEAKAKNIFWAWGRGRGQLLTVTARHLLANFQYKNLKNI